MSEISMLSRFQGCLAAIRICDAMGAPWEGMSAEKIRKETKRRGVQGFEGNFAKAKFADMRALRLGDATDDWQLTYAVARSLIRCKNFVPANCAVEHWQEMKRSAVGWGGTTRKSIGRIARYMEEGDLAEGTHPEEPARRLPGDKLSFGTGNGVAMKVAPLALFLANRRKPENLFEWVLGLGRITHPDPRAWISAFAIASLIYSSARGKSLCDSQYLLRSLKIFADHVTAWEKNVADYMPAGDRFSHYLNGAVSLDILEKNPAPIRKKIGTKCFCCESVPFAIATFWRHPTDFRAGVLEAINAGGDTDSTAAMVGALIGANCGIESIPEEWLNFSADAREEALDLAENLYKASQS